MNTTIEILGREYALEVQYDVFQGETEITIEMIRVLWEICPAGGIVYLPDGGHYKNTRATPLLDWIEIPDRMLNAQQKAELIRQIKEHEADQEGPKLGFGETRRVWREREAA